MASACSSTTERSWVTNSTPMSSSARSRAISAMICRAISGSRPVVGSSAMRSLGEQASAMAIITRWRMPPENWWG